MLQRSIRVDISALEGKTDGMKIIKRKIRRRVFASTAIYGAIAALKGNPFRVKADTDFLIEGYPRSANSFVEALIRVTQPKDWTLAHHTHAPASVREAARRGIPALVLIRDPRDAVASFGEMHPGPFDPVTMLREYVAFYEGIRDCRAHYILLDFSAIPEGLSEVPALAKEKYDFDMNPIAISDELIAEAHALGDVLGEQRNGVRSNRYSPFRSEEDKAARRKRLADNRAQLEMGEAGRVLKTALTLYEEFSKEADIKAD